MNRAAPKTGTKPLSDLLGGLELSGRTWCYTDISGHAGFSLPASDAVLFHAVIHGSLRIACTGGAVSELGPGDAAFVLSGEAHAARTAPNAPVAAHPVLRADSDCDIAPTVAVGSGPVGARILSGRLAARWPGEAARPAMPSLLYMRLSGEGPAAALLRPEALALAGMGAGSAALLTRLASLALVATLRADPQCRQYFSSSQADPIAQALLMIEARPAENWTVESLARSVGMGRSNFAAHFTQAVGRAPMEVVAEHRMEHAATLLRTGKLKIAEISELAGYGSEAAFSRRFTRHFGTSPSQMRAEARALEKEGRAAKSGFRKLLSGRLDDSAARIGRDAKQLPDRREQRGAGNGFMRLRRRD